MSGAEASDRYGQHVPLSSDERAELDRLRTENTLLRTERNILLRLTTDFARDAGFLSSDTEDVSPSPLDGPRAVTGTP